MIQELVESVRLELGWMEGENSRQILPALVSELFGLFARAGTGVLHNASAAVYPPTANP
ncbi:MAG: hypothetical protein ACOX87_11640 [Chloroflexota bacterium]|jgi:hypothetical protein